MDVLERPVEEGAACLQYRPSLRQQLLLPPSLCSSPTTPSALALARSLSLPLHRGTLLLPPFHPQSFQRQSKATCRATQLHTHTLQSNGNVVLPTVPCDVPADAGSGKERIARRSVRLSGPRPLPLTPEPFVHDRESIATAGHRDPLSASAQQQQQGPRDGRVCGVRVAVCLSCPVPPDPTLININPAYLLHSLLISMALARRRPMGGRPRRCRQATNRLTQPQVTID